MNSIKKIFLSICGLCFCAILLNACTVSDTTLCYKEGHSVTDDFCTYTCRHGSWESSCENKEIENCLNYIGFDIAYCTRRMNGAVFSDYDEWYEEYQVDRDIPSDTSENRNESSENSEKQPENTPVE